MSDGQVIISVVILFLISLVLVGALQGYIEARKIKKHKRIQAIRKKWLIAKTNCEVYQMKEAIEIEKLRIKKLKRRDKRIELIKALLYVIAINAILFSLVLTNIQ